MVIAWVRSPRSETRRAAANVGPEVNDKGNGGGCESSMCKTKPICREAWMVGTVHPARTMSAYVRRLPGLPNILVFPDCPFYQRIREVALRKVICQNKAN